MDLIYYTSGILIVLGIPFFGALIIAALIKPHLVNDRKIIKNPMSRKKIASIGTTTMLVSLVSFSSVLAATEPASVKADRTARESAEAKALQVQQDTAKQQAKANADRFREKEAAKPVVKTETKVEIVPFESTERNDGTIPVGEKRTSVAGVAGERTITYEVTYAKGDETKRTETKNEITKAPVTQVTLNGTYVKPAPAPAPRAAAPSCPNGTYVNSAGNTVCSPYQSNGGAPAGATARCSDGTYSFSQSRRGTCSGHGGVASWL